MGVRVASPFLAIQRHFSKSYDVFISDRSRRDEKEPDSQYADHSWPALRARRLRLDRRSVVVSETSLDGLHISFSAAQTSDESLRFDTASISDAGV